MKPLDINSFEKLSKIEQDNIKKEIIVTNELESIPVFYLPEPTSSSYYFISYSHKNYKEVYLDLFALDSVGFPFWYDRGIPAGKSWKDIAVKYLEPFECKGVVFYISEEALISDSIYDEINFTLETEKPFLVIFLGKEPSITDLIKRLYKERKIDKERYEFFLDVFKEDIIYLKLHDAPETKKEKIMNSLPRQKLLSVAKDEDDTYYAEIHSYDLGDRVEENEEIVQYINLKSVSYTVDGSNDFYVKEIKETDFIDVLSLFCSEEYLNYDDDDKIKVAKNMNQKNVEISCFIDRFAFANLRYLEKVALPYNVTIGECAFGRTKKLKEIKFVTFGKQKKDVVIGEFAFSGCESLENFDFTYVSDIKEGAFKNCTKLKSVKLEENYHSKEVPFSTFYGCKKLGNLILNNNIETVSELAFYECSSLKTLVLPKELRTISYNAFSDCSRLTNITFNDKIEVIERGAFSFVGERNKPFSINLPHSLKYIGKSAFIYSSIHKIIYDGNYSEFCEISKNCFKKADKNDLFSDVIELVCNDKTVMIIHLPDQDLYPWEMNV